MNKDGEINSFSAATEQIKIDALKNMSGIVREKETIRLSGRAAVGYALVDSNPGDPWENRALCAQTDPEAFFPEKGGPYKAAVAKKVCMACDVRVECLNNAIEKDFKGGIYGGLDERERRNIKKAA